MKFGSIGGIAIVLAVAMVVGLSAAAGATTVQNLVDQVSQANYTDILNNKMYAHTGDNRFLTGPQHDLCANNVYLQFRRYGWTTYFDKFAGKSEGISGPGRNVIAIKQGETTPDQIYIVGGHYDSKRLDSTHVAPGGDDNASGVAGILEVARVLAQHRYASTIVLVAFDNEEGIASGSNVDHHGGSIHMAGEWASRNVKGMISFDMIAWNNPSSLNMTTCRGTRPQASPTIDSLQQAVASYGDGLGWGLVPASDDSDHYPFILDGFSAVYWCETDGNPYHHNMLDCLDTAGYIDYAYATKLNKVIVGWLATQAGLID